MNKLAFKKELLRNAEWRIEQKEAEFSKEITRLQEGSEYKPEEQDTLVKMSLDDVAKDTITTLDMERNFAHEQLLHLIALESKDKLLDKVEPGAVVVTDTLTFFISAAVDEFELDGQLIHCISTDAPIYREMAGKKKGDHFTFRDRKYTIRDLY